MPVAAAVVIDVIVNVIISGAWFLIEHETATPGVMDVQTGAFEELNV